MIVNKIVVLDVRKFRSPGRLYDVIFYGGTYMWVLNIVLAYCDISSIQNFEGAHKYFENLWSPGCYAFI